MSASQFADQLVSKHGGLPLLVKGGSTRGRWAAGGPETGLGDYPPQGSGRSRIKVPGWAAFGSGLSGNCSKLQALWPSRCRTRSLGPWVDGTGGEQGEESILAGEAGNWASTADACKSLPTTTP